MIQTRMPLTACPPNNVCKYGIGNNPQNAIMLHCNIADAEPIPITINRNITYDSDCVILNGLCVDVAINGINNIKIPTMMKQPIIFNVHENLSPNGIIKMMSKRLGIE